MTHLLVKHIVTSTFCTLLLLLQQQGNNKLRVGLKSKNRLLLREAVEAYTKGLALKCSDTQVRGLPWLFQGMHLQQQAQL